MSSSDDSLPPTGQTLQKAFEALIGTLNGRRIRSARRAIAIGRDLADEREAQARFFDEWLGGEAEPVTATGHRMVR